MKVGDSVKRPDALSKVTGNFVYASDLWEPSMLWGATLRSPHPHARLRFVEIDDALELEGVHAVLTGTDVPGENFHGLERLDQPVLASEVVRYEGEAIAIVAAESPEIARRAIELIKVDYQILTPLTNPWEAIFDKDAPKLYPNGNITRYIPIRRGDLEEARADSDVIVSGEYEVGMQDQAFLGPEAGLATPRSDGGVKLQVASQWIHYDQIQIARALALPKEKVLVELSGVGGAFGGREDLSVHVHACMLALKTGRTVKMAYGRHESFHGHVHRHPARMHYEHGANSDGTLQYVKATVVFDGGPYASCSPEVIFNAAVFGAGPYVTQATHTDCYSVFTNNPMCGAMRGFGAVQVATAYEAQMDKLAAKLGMHPIEFRLKNALAKGRRQPTTGQRHQAPAPVAELLQAVRDLPLPPASNGDQRSLPGGLANTTRGEGVRRGIGYAVGFKNVAFGEGSDDYSIASIRVGVEDGLPVVVIGTAAAEVGQGLVTVVGQIVQDQLGKVEVRLATPDTILGDPGPTSASRQTYTTGGAVKMACEKVKQILMERASSKLDVDRSLLKYRDGAIGFSDTEIAIADLLDVPVYESAEYHHDQTLGLDPATGEGDATLQFAFCAHRAVVDVDTELGLVKIVALDAAQDVGRALNPQSIVGQIQGGSLQGAGLAVMEELLVEDGKLRNPSFTDYLIPTIVDSPPMQAHILEHPDEAAPYGLRGVGEPPTISSTCAVAAAIRDATGLELSRVPIRTDDICFPYCGHVGRSYREPLATSDAESVLVSN